MGKVLKTIAMVAAMGALIVSTGGLALFGTTAGITLFGVSAATLTLVSLGAGIAATLLTPNPKIPGTQMSRLSVGLDPSTPRKAVFGTTAMPLDIRYHESSGTDQEYVDYIVALAAHKVTSIDEIWFEEKQAWTAAGGVTGTYAGYLTITTRTEGSAANYININGGGKWGSSRRLTGCAYLHIRIKRTGNTKKAESPLVSGLPSRVTVIGNGALLYDPRKDSTVAGGSGTHRATDQTTWGAYTNADDTDNPALQLLWWLLGWKINGKLSVGCGVPSSRIDIASFITAANICDENVTLAIGGTQKRYRTSGTASDADDRKDVINTFLMSMNGTIRDNGGKLKLTVMKNDLAQYTLQLDETAMLGEFDWQQTGGLTENYNLARGRYTDPSPNSLYQMIDYPEVGFASPDGVERVLSVDLAYVEDGRRAQRIANQMLQRNQYRGVFSAVFNAKALGCQVGDVVLLSIGALGFSSKPFRVISQEIRFDGQVPMALIEENAAIYAWDANDVAPITPTAPTIYNPLNNPFILGLAAAEAVADGKIDSYYQASAPTGATEGDYWTDTDDSNKLYRYTTGVWTLIRDTGIPAAITAAAGAQATADGKVTTFYVETTPTAQALGDLWYKPSTKYLTRWNGTAWADVATVGAKAGSNLFDSTGATLADAAIITSQGTAALIANQAATATNSDFSVITGATKPANNATVGAVAGTNLKDSGGTVLSDAAIKNSQQLWAEVSGTGRPADNATVGAAWGSNLTGKPQLLTGEGVTVDEFLLDPSVWAYDITGAFSNSSSGDGWFSNTGGSMASLATKFANATPIDPSASYEVSIDLIEDGTGAGTATSYLGVALYDASGTVIGVDGTWWHYFKAAEAVYERGKWETYSVRIGKGTAKPFPANASKFGLVAYVNYNNLPSVTCRVRRMKSRRVTDQSWTASIPNRWTLANGRIVRNVGAYSWGNTAVGRAGIKGPQRFSWRWAGPDDSYSTMCGLSETATPVNFTDGVFTAQASDTAGGIFVYEAATLKASYTGQSDRNTAEFAIEYDGLKLQLFKNGVAYGYSRFVGPDKTYYPFIDTYYPTSTGIIDVKHSSTQSMAVVGGNTFDSAGTAWNAANGAGTTLKLLALGSITPAIVGNRASKTTGGGFDSAVVNLQAFKGTAFASCECGPGIEYSMPTLDDNITNYIRDTGTGCKAYVQYRGSTGSYEIYLGGVLQLSGTTTANVTGTVSVVYDGLTFSFYLNQTLLGSYATTAGQTLYAKWLIFNSGSPQVGMQAGFATDRAWSQLGGTGKPSDNANNTYVDANGAIQGVSSNAGTAVRNTLIQIDASGNFVNAGATGNGTSVNNSLVARRFVSRGSVAAVIEGNTIYRASGDTDYNSFVSGDAVAGSCFAEAIVAPGSWTMLAFDTAAATGYYGDQDFVVHANPSAGINIYQNGNYLGSPSTPTAGQLLRIAYDGVSYRIFVNGAQVGANYAAPAAQTFFPIFNAYNGSIRYAGLDYGPYTDNAWASVGGTGRPSDNATSDIRLVGTGTGILITGNRVTRPTGGGDWTAQAYTPDGYVGGAYCSFSFETNAYVMAGLNTDPTSDASYVSLDFCWYCPADSTISHIYESASGSLLNAGAHTATTVFSIVYDNEYVRYLKDGVEVRAVYVGAGKKYHFDSSIVQSPGITNIRFGPYAAANAPLSFINTTGHTSEGNTVFKRSNATNDWDGKSISREISQGTAFVTGKLDTVDTFIGLHEVGNSNLTYPAFAFSFYRSSNGTWAIYEDGGSPLNLGTGYDNNTQWSIRYDGVNVRYYAGTTLLRTVASSADRSFQAGVSIFSQNSRVSAIQFGPYTDRAWANIAGTGKPENNATVGAAWGSNLTGRPTELTDGRIDTGLDTAGRNKVGINAGSNITIANEALLEGINGTQLHPNPEFQAGSLTGWSVYNNAGGSRVSLAVAYDSGIPNGTDYRLAVTVDAASVQNSDPTPGWGGVHCSLTDAGVGAHSRPNKYARGTFIYHKIRAKIPVGRTINWASNATGNEAYTEFLTTQDGTGDWKLYVMRQYIGRTGTFSSTGFFYIAGGASGGFTWYIAKWDQIDATSAPVSFLGNGGIFDEDGSPLSKSIVRNDLQLWGEVSGTGKPENNADVTLTAQVTTQSPDDVIINADYLGAILANQFNKITTPIVTKAGSSVRTDNRATYTVTNITGGLTGFVSVNNTTASADKGRATITNCTSTGSYTHNIFWDGILIAAYLVKFTVVAADPPLGGGGSGGTKSGSVDITGQTVSSTSFVSIAQINNLTKAAGETIKCTLPVADYELYHTATSTRNVIAKFQYSATGANSWTDVGTQVSGSSSTWDQGDFSSSPGSITVSQNVAPSNGAYDIRLVVARNISGGGNLNFTYGTMAVIIEV